MSMDDIVVSENSNNNTNESDKNNDISTQRKTLNGAWKLDKTRGEPSLRGFLETMGVSELAIVAHEKGEQEHETIQIIFLTDKHYKIKKLSRVNDLVEEFELNKESIKIYPPGDRKKITLSTSNGLNHVNIHTKMPTMNGLAEVTDIKTLLTSSSGAAENNDLFPKDADPLKDIFLLQKLTIKNIAADKSHTSRRYYKPYYDDSKDMDISPPDITTATAAATTIDSKNDFMDVADDDEV